MSWRVKAYYHKTGPAELAHPLASNSFNTKEEADALLTDLLALPGFTGGHIEVHAPPFGWVLEEDVESIMICARRRESVNDDALQNVLDNMTPEEFDANFLVNDDS